MNAAGVRDRSTRGGPVVRSNSSIGLWHYVDLDNRGPVFFGYNGFYGGDGKGTGQIEVNPGSRGGRAGPQARGRRAVLPQQRRRPVGRNVTDAVDVTHNVFGRLQSAHSRAATFRAKYTMSPTLSFQSYAEPFISAGRYERFRELTNGRAANLRRAVSALTTTVHKDPDFNFRSSARPTCLRWEYKPGSALFVVWQQGRQDEVDQGDFRFGRDVGGLFSTPSRDVCLVKFSYWFNY